jgi:hypothetical protein
LHLTRANFENPGFHDGSRGRLKGWSRAVSSYGSTGLLWVNWIRLVQGPCLGGVPAVHLLELADGEAAAQVVAAQVEFERHILKPGFMFKGKGLTPGAFQLWVMGVNVHRPTRLLSQCRCCSSWQSTRYSMVFIICASASTAFFSKAYGGTMCDPFVKANVEEPTTSHISGVQGLSRQTRRHFQALWVTTTSSSRSSQKSRSASTCC